MAKEVKIVKPLARSLIYKNKSYKTTRKAFRGIAACLWVGMSVMAFVAQRSKLHEEVAEPKHARDRVRRSSGSAIDPEQLKPEEQAYYPYRPVYTDACKKALPRDKFDPHNEDHQAHWDDWFDKHRDIYKERFNFENHFDADTAELDVYGKMLCCLEEQDKHFHHQGAKSEFPKFGLFTDEELKSGAFLIHLLASLYMFAALAIVCDDYFVPALERISEELQLSEDVAGATFMAAGSSAPELFTSMIGVFVAKSDIGIGTIVGSAVFNILVIIAACGLFVDGETKLSVWPLFRDSFFYLITILILLLVIFPEFDVGKCPLMTPKGVFDCNKAGNFQPSEAGTDGFAELCTCDANQILATAENEGICTEWDLEIQPGFKRDANADSFCQTDDAKAGMRKADDGKELGYTNRYKMNFLEPADGHNCVCKSFDKSSFSNCHVWKSSAKSLAKHYDCANDANFRREKGKYLEECECAVFHGFSRMDLIGSLGKCGKSEVFMWEAVAMLIAYSFYIIIMKFNSQLEDKFSAITGIVRDKGDEGNDNNNNNKSNYATCASVELSQADQANVEQLVYTEKDGVKPKIEFDNLGMRVMMTDSFAPKTRLRMAAKAISQSPDDIVVAKETQEDGSVKTILIQKRPHAGTNASEYQDSANFNNNNNNDEEEGENKGEEEEEEDEGPVNPWELPSGGFGNTTKFLLGWPINLFLYYTVPQCGKEGSEHLYLISFVMSTVWIAVYSYIMVWMVAYCGFAMGIPDTIMGLTFLAAGTSVPDTIASVLVARQGMGDMAVSNSIGSNVFDILLGLAAPWACQMVVATLVPPPPCQNLAQFTETVVINSSGLVISCSMLLASLVFVVSVIHFNGWKLTRKAGVLITIAYLFFIIGSIWNESAAAVDNGMTCAKAIDQANGLGF